MFSQRALEKLRARKTKPGSYNLDLNLVGDYWCVLQVLLLLVMICSVPR